MTRKERDGLIRARALVEAGWMQGRGRNIEGTKFCALGACAEAMTCAQALAVTLNEIYGFGMPIAAFNDASNTTKDDVLGLFDLAIAGVGQ